MESFQQRDNCCSLKEYGIRLGKTLVYSGIPMESRCGLMTRAETVLRPMPITTLRGRIKPPVITGWTGVVTTTLLSKNTTRCRLHRRSAALTSTFFLPRKKPHQLKGKVIGPKRPHSRQLQPEWVAFKQNAGSTASQSAFPKILRWVISDSGNGLPKDFEESLVGMRITV